MAQGCAVESAKSGAITTQSLRAPRVAKAPAASGTEKLRAFCAQRHIDYQTGKAETPEQKEANDRACQSLDPKG
jgi:hypothetical protein